MDMYTSSYSLLHSKCIHWGPLLNGSVDNEDHKSTEIYATTGEKPDRKGYVLYESIYVEYSGKANV